MNSRKLLFVCGLAAVALSPVAEITPAATAATRDKAVFESVAGSL